jgi:2-keto-3-deoxy-L-rhamnonate aldolase RhmA/quercetin dioxygenase-like cupin family protein
MNRHAIETLRRRLASGAPALGLWVTLESPSITEIAAALGLDWVVIDAEHGHLDWKEILDHLRALSRSTTVGLVRIATLDAAIMTRVLDLGADGVVVPRIESAAQAREAVAMAKYPPGGRRGIGGERATGWGQALAEHAAEANDHVLVVPIIETAAGIAAADDIVAVDGVELCFFGPADLSASYGHRSAWEGSPTAEQILAVKDRVRSAGKHCGTMARNADDLLQRIDQGFRMIGLASDVGLLAGGLKSLAEKAGRSLSIRADLVAGGTADAPLRRPPAHMRPDRGETMTRPGAGDAVDLAAGVRFESLAGKGQGARDLTAGIVTLTAGAALDCHEHPTSESITVLEGRLTVDVEDRRYELGPLDNICIPRGLAHAAMNPVATVTRAHIAMPTSAPVLTLVPAAAAPQLQPEGSRGVAGKERVTRFATARRTEAGPNTSFIDHFNAAVMPGLEMSGGYGLFMPGGRLPAHVHDFDEAITIIDGVAACLVEGRRYVMSGCETAMQPRGRVHYFRNETDATMAMLWVYAGPMPERIVVEERCCTAEGNPWT